MNYDHLSMNAVHLSEDEQMFIQDGNLFSIRPSGTHIIPLADLPTFISALQQVSKWHEREQDAEAMSRLQQTLILPVSNYDEAEIYMAVLKKLRLIPSDSVLAAVQPRAGVDIVYLSPVPKSLIEGPTQ